MNSLIGLIILVGGLIILRLLAERYLTATIRRSKLFMLTYVGILLLGLPVSYFISPNQAREDSSQLISQAEEATDAFHRAIYYEERLPEAEHISELQHWTVPYEGTGLTISSHGQADALVLVGRQQHSGEDIRITYYTTPYVIDQIDYTHLISPPDVFLANNDLYISPSSASLDLKFVGFRKDFYIAHFTGDERNIGHGHVHIRGNGFFYVEVPPELEIEATDGISLIFVED